MAIADLIADRLLDRSVDLARLEAGERRKVLLILNDMERQIVRLLKQEDPTAPKLTRFRQQRLEKLLTEVREVTRSTYRSINTAQQRVLRGVAVAEGPAVATAINPVVGSDLITAGLGEARLKAIASDLLVQGAPAREWWQRQAATMQLRFQDTMRRGLLVGDDLGAMIRNTRQITQTQQRSAEALVRTSIQSVQNATRLSIFEANRDAADVTQWVSTMDTRTCPQCQAISGLTWNVETKEPIGHNKRWPGVPPLHWACRCTLIAIPAAFGPAEDLSFETWLRRKSAKTQRQVLGKGRYELWKAGRITLSQLTDQSHRPLSLADLQSRAA